MPFKCAVCDVEPREAEMVCMECIARATTAKADAWISVTDRLPDKPGRYLVWTCHGWPAIAYWQLPGWSSEEPRWADGPGLAAFSFAYGVTHWREQPEGPRS